MPCILLRGCDIGQPISKQHLQSSASKCERQLNSQQLTNTERACDWGRKEERLHPIKQNSRLAPHLPRLGVIFDSSNFQLCGYEIITDRVSRPWGLRGWKWPTEKRQLRALIELKWGWRSLWLRRFYAPLQCNVVRLWSRLWCVFKRNF